MIRHGDPVDVIPALAAEVGADTRVRRPRLRAVRASSRRRGQGGARRATAGTCTGVGSPYAVAPGSVTQGRRRRRTPCSRRSRRCGAGSAGTSRSTSPATTSGGRRPRRGVESEPLGDRPDPGMRTARRGRGARPTIGGTRSCPTASTQYPDRRDLPAVAGTSQLSPALKWGTIHPRQLLADLDASGAGPKGHTVFSSELAWREFYADVLFQQPRTAWENLNPKMDAMPVDTDAAARKRFDRWAAGETGFGIVDAGMRQLAATGWMHNRVRMIVGELPGQGPAPAVAVGCAMVHAAPDRR